MKRRSVHATAGLALALALSSLAAACSSAGSDTASSSTTRTTATTTPATTAVPGDTPSSSAVPTTTEAAPITALPPCQELLQQYTDAFLPDHLLPVAQLFRQWAPFMPTDVAAASLRIAQAYEDAQGDLANVDMASQDLTDDAQVFSDWTAAGCPAR